MKAREFRGLAPAALRNDLETKRKELLDLRCQVALGEEVHPHRLREVRRDIARLLTVLGEKEGSDA